MKPLLGLGLLLTLAAAAFAASGVTLTIYNKDMAMVHETRPLTFMRGVSEMSFTDVAARLDPTSVQFSAPGVVLLEQNFDYDLVSSGALLKRFLGKEIEVVNSNNETVRGTLLNTNSDPDGRSSADPQIVLQQEDGKLRSVTGGRIVEVRYPLLPEGLISRPTLRWKVNAAEGGSKTADISYLTQGMNWHAEYSLLIGENSDAAHLEAWVTIDNRSGATYRDAKLKLMAGETHQARKGRGEVSYLVAPQSADANFESKGFFEYHMYTLQTPTTLADRETKQISLFTPADLRVRRLYEYYPPRKADRVTVFTEFDNKQANGLGIPLPQGLVRVSQKDTDGAREYLGEDRIQHTPRNEVVRVAVGEAFDIVGTKTVTNTRSISANRYETDVEIRLRNHKDKAITVTYRDDYPDPKEIVRSSQPVTRLNATTVSCDLKCEPEQEVILSFTIRYGQ